MIPVLAALALSPLFPVPDPPPNPTLDPVYVTAGDGSRLQCSPMGTYCWPDTTGLPPYLVPSGRP